MSGRLILLVLLSSLLAHVPLGVTGGQAAAQSPSRAHMVVYDLSNSMWSRVPRAQTSSRSDIRRWHIAGAYLQRAARRLREAPPSQLVGMVLLGSKYHKELGRCSDDVDYAVPTAQIGSASDPLGRIARLAETLPAKGLTPLLDALVEAARRMPPSGGEITVVTDLDEEICGGDPCLLLESRLAEIGKPLHSVVTIGWVIATGLDSSNLTEVTRMATCLKAKLRVARTLQDASTYADEVVDALLHPPPPPPPPPREQHAQARMRPVRMTVQVRWSRPLAPAFADWAADELRARAEYLDEYGNRSATPFAGNAASIVVPSSPATRDIYVTAPEFGMREGPSPVAGVEGGTVSMKLEPSNVTASLTVVSPGTIEGARITWVLTSGSRQDEWQTREPSVAIALPPGRHTLSARVDWDGAPQVQAQPIEVALRYNEGAAVALQVRRPPTPGELVVRGAGCNDEPFAGGARATLRDVAGREAERIWTVPMRAPVEAGRYRLDVATAGSLESIASLEVTAGRRTTVCVSSGLGRLVVAPQWRDNSPFNDAETAWRLTRQGGRSIPLHDTGPVLDTIVPAGTYHIEVLPRGGRGEDDVTVEPGKIVDRTILLGR